MGKKMAGVCLLSLWLSMFTSADLYAQSEEAVGVITELKFNTGDIQVRQPSAQSFERASALQALRAGSRVQASKDATAVILFTDSMKTVTVDEKNSPLAINAPKPGESQPSRRIRDIVNLLVGKRKPPVYVSMGGRGRGQPATLLSPRNTKVMNDAPTFYWIGMDRQPGTVKVYGPEGLIWSAENLSVSQIKYPASAPRLRAGGEYSWVIEKAGFTPQKAAFKLLTAKEVESVQEQLAALNASAGISKTTVTIIKANLLSSNDLMHEAREILAEAVNQNPGEPALRFLLGEVYEKTGLRNLAEEEYREAEYLEKKGNQ